MRAQLADELIHLSPAEKRELGEALIASAEADSDGPPQLTDAQRKATWRVYQDLQKSQPMNRLLEGHGCKGAPEAFVARGKALMDEGYAPLLRFLQ